MVNRKSVIFSIFSLFILGLFLVSDVAAVNNLTNGSIINKITTNYKWMNDGEETELSSQSITDPITDTPTFTTQQEYEMIAGFGWWNESEDLENTALINDLNIACDKNNNSHLFWSTKIEGEWYLYHRIRFLTNSSWSAIENMGKTVESNLEVFDVEADSKGRIHLVFTSNTLLKYRLYDNEEWIIENTIGPGQRPSLEIGKNDEVRVLFLLRISTYTINWFYAEYSELRQEWISEHININFFGRSEAGITFDFMIKTVNGQDDDAYLFIGLVARYGYRDPYYQVEYYLFKRDNRTTGFYFYDYARYYEIPGPIYYLSKPLVVNGLGDDIHLIYTRPIDNYNFELRYHKRGTNGWGTSKLLTTDLSLKCYLTAKVDKVGRLLLFWNYLNYINGSIPKAGLHMFVYSPLQNAWSANILMYPDYDYVQLNRMALDLNGNVHLVWIDQSDDNRPIKYRVGWTDSDEDGLIDRDEELVYGTDPYNPDTDNDQLLDGEEIEYGFDPFDPDEDSDGMYDGYEFHNGLDPYTNDSYLDLDMDLLLNIEEFLAGSLPNTNDTDLDSVSDFDEVKTYFTNPCEDDTDDDNIPDGVEIFDLGSNPNLNDTDSDGMHDYYEWVYSLQILVNDSYDDPDLDGLVNILEYENGIRPDKPDTDSDGLNDYDEVIVWGTHPINLDTDNDNIWDGPEVHTYHTHPLMKDTDSDYLDDFDELFVVFTNATNNDTDGDLMLDGFEWFYGLDPLNGTDWSYDPDGDGLTNIEESYHFTNPFSKDTDGDTLEDKEELDYGTNPILWDTDYDGLSDYVEIIVLKTNATNPDTDYDGLSDYLEVHVYSSDPKKQDSDGDGLLDGTEVNTYGSDPTEKDTDDDKLDDNLEVDFGSSLVLKDTDADGMEDYFEWLYGLDPLFDDSREDPDNDGVRNGEEFIYKANPLLNDTDSDGLNDYDEIIIYYTQAYSNDTDKDFLSDYDEIMVYYTLAHDPDTDDDSILDGIEVLIGTDPILYDTDSDGISDGDELAQNTDPLDPNDNIIINRTRIIVISFSSIIGGLLLYNFVPLLLIRFKRNEETNWVKQGIIWRRKKSEILMQAANEEQARMVIANNMVNDLAKK